MGRSFQAVMALMIVVVVVGTSARLGAPWFKYRTPGVPRTRNGEVNLSALDCYQQAEDGFSVRHRPRVLRKNVDRDYHKKWCELTCHRE